MMSVPPAIGTGRGSWARIAYASASERGDSIGGSAGISVDRRTSAGSPNDAHDHRRKDDEAAETPGGDALVPNRGASLVAHRLAATWIASMILV
jgi:hypothetical protein